MTTSRYLTPYQVETMKATLRDHMQVRGLTCAALSRLSPAPLSASAIAQALRDSTIICTTMLAGRIAHALGMDLDTFIGDPDPPAPEPCVSADMTPTIPGAGVIDDTPPWRLTVEAAGEDLVVRLYGAGAPYAAATIRGESQVRSLIVTFQDALMEHAYQMGLAEGKRSSFSLAP